MTIAIQVLMRELERVWDTWWELVHVRGDVAGALELTTPGTAVVNTPAGTGGEGRDAVRAYLTDTLLPHLPADLARRRISRTVDKFRVVDEVVVSFTHDRELPWLLPGHPPSGRQVAVAAVTVVGFHHGRIAVQRTLWDHAGLLAAIGG